MPLSSKDCTNSIPCDTLLATLSSFVTISLSPASNSLNSRSSSGLCDLVPVNVSQKTASAPFSFNSFRMGMNAYWYFGSFYVSAYGSLPTVQISQDGTKTREKGFYCVSAGWSNGNVQLSLIISNFANWKWDGGNITSYNSTYYDSWSQSFSNGSRHADFRFKMAWTIGYGKKIRRSDEIGVQSSIESGAL